MLTVFLRSIIIFTTVFVVLRLMGKRQIGEMQPYELVITLIIADLACVPMSDVSIPLLYGIVAILAIFLVHTVIVMLSKKSVKLRKFFTGKPVVVMNPQGIDFEELTKLNMTIADLEENLRNAGCFSFEDVQYAIVETNGKLSVITKTKDDPEPTLPVMIITSGKMNFDNLKASGYTEDDIAEFLSQNGAKAEEVLFFSVDENGEVYFQVKGEAAQSGQLEG